MSGDNEKTIKKWNVIKEQLIALCALNKLPKGNEDFAKFLSEDIQLKNLNSQSLNSICYYLLGIINSEERDRLIRWPLINIQTNTKFRKGVSAMVTSFQEKHPWANIKKLPESYFMNPHGYQSRVVDFILRLTNLAIHIALEDPELLLLHSGDGLNAREVSVMTEIISKATQNEEILMNNNVLPLKEFEEVKNEICGKCITLIQENDGLQQQLNALIKHATSEKILPEGKTIGIEDLKQIKDKKLLELNSINDELLKYYDASRDLLSKIRASKNPKSLSAKDFGESSPPNLAKATSRVCGDLCQLFQYITAKNSTMEDEDYFYEQIKAMRKCLKEENEAYQLFLSKMSSISPTDKCH